MTLFFSACFLQKAGCPIFENSGCRLTGRLYLSIKAKKKLVSYCFNIYTVAATQKNLGQWQQVDKLEIRYEVIITWFHEIRIPNFHVLWTTSKKDEAKGGFFQKVQCVFQISKKIYSKKLSWTWNLNFKLRIVFWNIFFFGDLEI